MRFDELSRREMMRLSAAGVLTAGMSGWLDVLSARAAEQAKEAAAAGKPKPRHKSCILLWMAGGPSQMDTFDLKPGSPNGGEFKPIATSVPGIQISEHMPKLAGRMEHMALLRGMSTGEGSHGRARVYLHTGYKEGVGGLTYPSLGSIASSELGEPDFELPNFVAVGGAPVGPGFLGPRHAPLTVGDPARGVENLKAFGDQSAFDDKFGLLEEMEAGFHERFGGSAVAGAAAKAHRTTYERAVALMRSEKAKAFDLSGEPASVRAMYGLETVSGPGVVDKDAKPGVVAAGKGKNANKFAEGCLLARRLVEAGVPFVEVTLGGWDTHENNFERVKNLSTQVDNAMAGLMDDLKARGLLDSTLVIWMGEFGRTPKINGRGEKPGRDHFPRAWSTVLAGGGIKGGQVIGRTSKDGDTVEERPIAVVDFMATVCKALDIDHTKKFETRGGRPIRIVDKDEKVISELF
jgi:hypothetical protein